MKSNLSPEYRQLLKRPEAEQYAALQKRCEEILGESRVLLAEAHRSGDQKTIEEMTRVIREVEAQKTSMRKPES